MKNKKNNMIQHKSTFLSEALASVNALEVSDAINLIDIEKPDIYKMTGKSGANQNIVKNFITVLRKSKDEVNSNHFEFPNDFANILDYESVDEIRSNKLKFYKDIAKRGYNRRKKYIQGRKRGIDFFKQVYYDNRILKKNENYTLNETHHAMDNNMDIFNFITRRYSYGNNRFLQVSVWSVRQSLAKLWGSKKNEKNISLDEYKKFIAELSEKISIQHHRTVGIYNKTRVGAKNFNKERDWNNRHYIAAAKDEYRNIRDEYYEEISSNLVKQIKANVR